MSTVRFTSPAVPRGQHLDPATIARGLASVPRWIGATLSPWSVLHHVVACLVAAQDEGIDDPLVLLYLTLHDVEELFTGDIPRPYKTEEQTKLGREIRAEIFAALGLPLPPPGIWEEVKRIDDRVGIAEQYTLTHPAFRPAGADAATCNRVWEIALTDTWRVIEVFAEFLGELFGAPEVQQFLLEEIE